MSKVGRLWNPLEDNKVECTACARRCRIPLGSRGFCYVRQNIDGELHLATYGIIDAMQIDPIEKKPFNHFMPGTYVFGIGTSSCNWGCSFCQNHNISKERDIKGIDISPEEVVELAIENNAQSIAFTYNEPTIFIEYAIDIAKLAHKKGLRNLFVTNGYMTEEAVAEMRSNIDAAVIDFKGSGEQKFANKYEMVVSNDPVKEALVILKDAGIHIEITDLIVPKVGDSEEACDKLMKFVVSELGCETPVHFTCFHPDYKMMDSVMTPYSTLLAHYNIAKRSGLDYVYIGNCPENQYENTYCPKCNSMVIKRYGFYITQWRLDKDSRCANCGNKVPIVGGAPKVLMHEEIRNLY